MKTPSTNKPYQLLTPNEISPSDPAPSGPPPADKDGEPSTLVLVEEAQSFNIEPRPVVLPVGESEFLEAAEQAIRERLACLCHLGQRALTAALELGEVFAQTKERLGHGKWLSFLRAVDINERTAQNYLLLHKHQQPVRAKYENNSLLTLSGALNLARQLSKAPEVEVPLEPAAAAGTVEEATPPDTVHPMPTVGLLGASLDPVQVEGRLVITRTIPPMRGYDDEDRAAFEECFRLLAATLHRAATEGIAGHEIHDDVLFAAVEAMYKFLVRRRKEAEV